MVYFRGETSTLVGEDRALEVVNEVHHIFALLSIYQVSTLSTINRDLAHKLLAAIARKTSLADAG